MPKTVATFLSALTLTLGLAFTLAAPSLAQDAAKPAASPGRELTVGKCVQCHSESIWRDQRLDARRWEATLYRMVARGAVWSGDDIKTMATYLATDFGPQSPKAAPAPR